MIFDINYCASSFLAFRYVENADYGFDSRFPRKVYHQHPDSLKKLVGSAAEIDLKIKDVFNSVKHEQLGLLLSGGMDSAILASYMPAGSNAYTFRFLGGRYQSDEIQRAEQFAAKYKLNLHYVDIDWSVVESCVDTVMRTKGAPVHSIEPQVYFAAQQMKHDGVTMSIIGDGSDYVFGGMDGLLSKDWSFEEYIDRVVYVNPASILCKPVSQRPVFERYRLDEEKIDFLRFYKEIITDESYSSYENAFLASALPYVDPYEDLKMSVPLDLVRIRRGESKYLVRELFKIKYPEFPIPEKLPMPRPVDQYFKDWKGPARSEFRKDVDYSVFSGNQKWLIWCLERFLNLISK